MSSQSRARFRRNINHPSRRSLTVAGIDAGAPPRHLPPEKTQSFSRSSLIPNQPVKPHGDIIDLTCSDDEQQPNDVDEQHPIDHFPRMTQAVQNNDCSCRMGDRASFNHSQLVINVDATAGPSKVTTMSNGNPAHGTHTDTGRSCFQSSMGNGNPAHGTILSFPDVSPARTVGNGNPAHGRCKKHELSSESPVGVFLGEAHDSTLISSRRAALRARMNQLLSMRRGADSNMIASTTDDSRMHSARFGEVDGGRVQVVGNDDAVSSPGTSVDAVPGTSVSVHRTGASVPVDGGEVPGAGNDDTVPCASVRTLSASTPAYSGQRIGTVRQPTLTSYSGRPIGPHNRLKSNVDYIYDVGACDVHCGIIGGDHCSQVGHTFREHLGGAGGGCVGGGCGGGVPGGDEERSSTGGHGVTGAGGNPGQCGFTFGVPGDGGGCVGGGGGGGLPSGGEERCSTGGHGVTGGGGTPRQGGRTFGVPGDGGGGVGVICGVGVLGGGEERCSTGGHGVTGGGSIQGQGRRTFGVPGSGGGCVGGGCGGGVVGGGDERSSTGGHGVVCGGGQGEGGRTIGVHGDGGGVVGVSRGGDTCGQVGHTFREHVGGAGGGCVGVGRGGGVPAGGEERSSTVGRRVTGGGGIEGQGWRTSNQHVDGGEGIGVGRGGGVYGGSDERRSTGGNGLSGGGGIQGGGGRTFCAYGDGDDTVRVGSGGGLVPSDWDTRSSTGGNGLSGGGGIEGQGVRTSNQHVGGGGGIGVGRGGGVYGGSDERRSTGGNGLSGGGGIQGGGGRTFCAYGDGDGAVGVGRGGGLVPSDWDTRSSTSGNGLSGGGGIEGQGVRTSNQHVGGGGGIGVGRGGGVYGGCYERSTGGGHGGAVVGGTGRQGGRTFGEHDGGGVGVGGHGIFGDAFFPDAVNTNLFGSFDPHPVNCTFSTSEVGGAFLGDDFFPTLPCQQSNLPGDSLPSPRNASQAESSSTGATGRIPRKKPPDSVPWQPTAEQLHYIQHQGRRISGLAYPSRYHRLETLQERDDFFRMVQSPQYHHMFENTVFNMGMCFEKPMPSYFAQNGSCEMDNLGPISHTRLNHTLEFHYMLGNVVNMYLARALSGTHYHEMFKEFVKKMRSYRREKYVVVVYYPIHNYDNYFLIVRNSTNVEDLNGMNAQWILDQIQSKRRNMKCDQNGHVIESNELKKRVVRQDACNFVDFGKCTLMCQERETAATGHPLPRQKPLTNEGGCVSLFIAASVFVSHLKSLVSQLWYNGMHELWVDADDRGARRAEQLSIHPNNLGEGGRGSVTRPGLGCGSHSDKDNPPNDPLSAVAGLFVFLFGERVGCNIFLRQSLSHSCHRIDEETPFIDRICHFYRNVSSLRRTVSLELLGGRRYSLIPGFEVTKHSCNLDPGSFRCIMQYCVMQLTIKYKLCSLGALSVTMAFQYLTNVPYMYYVATQMMLNYPPPKNCKGTKFGFVFLRLAESLQSSFRLDPEKQFRRFAMYNPPDIPDYQEYHGQCQQIFGYAANLHFQFGTVPTAKSKARSVYKEVVSDMKSLTVGVGDTITRIMLGLLGDLGFFPWWFRDMAVINMDCKFVKHVNDKYLSGRPWKKPSLDSHLETIRSALNLVQKEIDRDSHTSTPELTLMVAENSGCKWLRDDAEKAKDWMWSDVFCPTQQLVVTNGDYMTVISPDGTTQRVCGSLFGNFPCGDTLKSMAAIAQLMGLTRKAAGKKDLARISMFRSKLHPAILNPRCNFELEFQLMPPMALDAVGHRKAQAKTRMVYPRYSKL